jgi:hypothetical protein
MIMIAIKIPSFDVGCTIRSISHVLDLKINNYVVIFDIAIVFTTGYVYVLTIV